MQVTVPKAVRRAFEGLDRNADPRTLLLREVAARLVMDAVGLTGLPKLTDHNTAVSEARAWFLAETEEEGALFALAGIETYPDIRRAVLASHPQYR